MYSSSMAAQFGEQSLRVRHHLHSIPPSSKVHGRIPELICASSNEVGRVSSRSPRTAYEERRDVPLSVRVMVQMGNKTGYCIGRKLGSDRKRTMEFVDRVLKCVDCHSDFVFTAGEHLFFHERQFLNDPKRCKSCKAKRDPAAKRNNKETQVVCSGCGATTTVPFRPTQGRPVLCRACFQKVSHPT